MLDFGSQNLQNITKTASNIYEKSKNRGCGADAFIGAVLDRQSGPPIQLDWTTFGDHFRIKSKKWHPKRYPKIDAEKVLKIDAKIMRK